MLMIDAAQPEHAATQRPGEIRASTTQPGSETSR
jgi:hypothetical protein